MTAEVTGTQDAAGAYVGSATVALTAADDGSGVASTEYDLDGAGFAPYTAPVVVDEPGGHTVAYRATDTAGNVSETGSTAFSVVAAAPDDDTTAPAVTADVSGEQDATGAYVGSATVTLAATDAGSGVASIEYDAHGRHFVPYAEPLVVSEPGEQSIDHRATDVAGNVSEVGTVTFVVVAGDGGGEDDVTPPAVTAEVTGEQDAAGAYVGAATVTLTATDAGSGVASVEQDLHGAGFAPYTAPLVVTEPGGHTVAYRATDSAGNVSGTGSVALVVAVAAEPGDTGAPVVTASVTGGRNGAGAYVGRASLTLRATDDDSGVASIEYQVDDGAWRPYTARVVVDTPGAHTVAFRATDVAGNVSEPGSVSFVVASTAPVDTTAPQVSAALTGGRDSGGGFVGRATVTLQATDAGSGVALTEYRLDGGAWQRYTAPAVVVGLGNHTLAHRATDVAGNTSTTGSAIFTVVALRFDLCPGSDVRPTVVTGAFDSTVANVDTGDGCTVNDLVDEDGDYPDHRRFVQHVRTMTAALVEDGVIGAVERSRVVRAANLSDVGR